MVNLKFTLTPEASVRLHDVLVCLAKFDESVSLEARHDRVSTSQIGHNGQLSLFQIALGHHPQFIQVGICVFHVGRAEVLREVCLFWRRTGD